MENIMFSIIVVCLNPGDKLKMTIDSILMQKYDNYEIIVKDGMSKDGSIETLPKDERIKVFRKQDHGIYDAMNQAVEHISGHYVYFLNCGDVFYNAEILRQVSIQLENNKEEKPYIFYGDIYEVITSERISSNPRIDAFACYRNVPCHQACFYKAELVRQKKFDISYKVRADYDHFLWCFFIGKAKTVYMPLLIAFYEGGGFSETKENRKRSSKEHKEITEKYMTKGQIFKYKTIMILTLSAFRTWLARNKSTAHMYNKMKSLLYK